MADEPVTTWEGVLAALLAMLPAELKSDGWAESFATCSCGRLRWASSDECPACARGPLPSDEELKRRFDASPKLDDRHGAVRRLDPRTVTATPPSQIRRGGPRRR